MIILRNNIGGFIIKNILYYQNKIREFENKITPKLKYEEINNMLLELCSGVPLPISGVSWDESNYLYRARFLNKNIDLSKLTKDYFWEAPEDKVKSYGRLNEPGESIFYLSNNIFQTLHEIHFDNTKPVILSKFKIKRPFNSTFIGKEYELNENDSEDISAIVIKNLFVDFFRNQFSKPVGVGTEYLYLMSNSITKNFFDIPSELSQSWTYPAVENRVNLNVAFKNGVAKKYLEYDGSIIIINVKNNNLVIPAYFDESYNFNIYQDNGYEWINKHFESELKSN